MQSCCGAVSTMHVHLCSLVGASHGCSLMASHLAVTLRHAQAPLDSCQQAHAAACSAHICVGVHGGAECCNCLERCCHGRCGGCRLGGADGHCSHHLLCSCQVRAACDLDPHNDQSQVAAHPVGVERAHMSDKYINIIAECCSVLSLHATTGA